MQGKTHAVCGGALAVAVLAPVSFPALGSAMAGGMLGALCPDIDCDSSHAYKGVTKFALYVALIFGLCYALDYVYGTALLAALVNFERGRWTAARIIGLALLIAYFIACALSAHRTLTHSLVGMAVATAAVYLVAPGIWQSFALGYASHLALDLLNKQKEQLLWPLGDGYALYVCKSDGAMNQVLLFIGIIALVMLIVFSAPVTALITTIAAKITAL